MIKNFICLDDPGYGKVGSLDSLLVEFRSEIMKNCDFYSHFFTKDINVLLELDRKHHLKYYNKTPLTYF